ncbi:hypothetical protein AAFF_G00135800 [Aldrovandia affinis]|uniref:Uncharacterized protein n=1 Tax=Aldrovandia affinis TaxID=143900 RepID=A0AAD7RPY3_9TELE|nr:hypothetical protein AAFF_G00135800 [Aldrovandia affinis]
MHDSLKNAVGHCHSLVGLKVLSLVTAAVAFVTGGESERQSLNSAISDRSAGVPARARRRAGARRNIITPMLSVCS